MISKASKQYPAYKRQLTSSGTITVPEISRVCTHMRKLIIDEVLSSPEIVNLYLLSRTFWHISFCRIVLLGTHSSNSCVLKIYNFQNTNVLEQHLCQGGAKSLRKKSSVDYNYPLSLLTNVLVNFFCYRTVLRDTVGEDQICEEIASCCGQFVQLSLKCNYSDFIWLYKVISIYCHNI